MFRLIAILFFAFSAFSNLMAQDYNLPDKAKQNLILCVQHENDGVRSAGVHFVGKYHVIESIPYLCKVLESDPNPRIRKLAAFALFRMNDKKGLFAIKEALKLNDSEEVRLFCSTMFEISERE